MGEIQIQKKWFNLCWIPIGKLKNFQGNLKELQEVEYNKLKKSLNEKGFRVPLFIWKNQILDGHQRLFVLNKIGFKGDLPCIELQAKNEREAKQLLLLINSRYAKITQDGLYEFLEKGGITLDSMEDMLDFPEFSFESFKNNFYNDPDLSISDENPSNKKDQITCPKCGNKW